MDCPSKTCFHSGGHKAQGGELRACVGLLRDSRCPGVGVPRESSAENGACRAENAFVEPPSRASSCPLHVGPTSDLLQRLPKSMNAAEQWLEDASVGHVQSVQPLSAVCVSPCNLSDDHFCSKGIMTHAGDLWNGRLGSQMSPSAHQRVWGSEQVWTKAELGGSSSSRAAFHSTCCQLLQKEKPPPLRRRKKGEIYVFLQAAASLLLCHCSPRGSRPTTAGYH